MPEPYRDLNYLRLPVPDLEVAEQFGVEILGLMLDERNDDALYFRSDARNYALCYISGSSESVGLTVGSEAEVNATNER